MCQTVAKHRQTGAKTKMRKMLVKIYKTMIMAKLTKL